MSQVDNRIVIATGGTQGIGAATARLAAERGAGGVVICGRQRDKGEAVVQDIKQRGCDALYIPADLARPDDCHNVVQRCIDHFGRVDGLVNAAADTRRGSLHDTTVEFWDHLFAVNVRGPFLMIQACAREMQRQGDGGSIVNILSVTAYCGAENLVAYSSTKGALLTLTKNAAHSLRHDRIRVNGIVLGWTDTPAEHEVQRLQGSPEDWLQQAERKSPFGRLLKPQDVARLCLYLLSDESGILTGSNIDFAQRVMGYVPPEMLG